MSNQNQSITADEYKLSEQLKRDCVNLANQQFNLDDSYGEEGKMRTALLHMVSSMCSEGNPYFPTMIQAIRESGIQWHDPNKGPV